MQPLQEKHFTLPAAELIRLVNDARNTSLESQRTLRNVRSPTPEAAGPFVSPTCLKIQTPKHEL